MRQFLQHMSPQMAYDGWALRRRGADLPISVSVCTTRREARELRNEHSDLADDFEVVKVRISVEVVK